MTIKLVLPPHKDQRFPVKICTDDVDHNSQAQLSRVANLPFIHKHVAAMPDVHLGKGAIRARNGDLGIIPGSMGNKSYIVRGKGEKDSFCSCSHGAGRRMSRGEANRQFTVTDLENATTGVECRKDAGVIDEIPMAYKPIDEVMANQSDLVDVIHTLKQVLNVKG